MPFRLPSYTVTSAMIRYPLEYRVSEEDKKKLYDAKGKL